jgi:hypothetical protein
MSGRDEIDRARTDPGTLREAMVERVGRWADSLATGHAEGLQEARGVAVEVAAQATTPEGRAAAREVARRIAAILDRRRGPA